MKLGHPPDVSLILHYLSDCKAEQRTKDRDVVICNNIKKFEVDETNGHENPLSIACFVIDA